eukprot:Rhum_TRINITY_DN9618_c0_g1::Rhum_TRINITY_DN9618_c0_g1_i1::g.34379::m.34379
MLLPRRPRLRRRLQLRLQLVRRLLVLGVVRPHQPDHVALEPLCVAAGQGLGHLLRHHLVAVQLLLVLLVLRRRHRRPQLVRARLEHAAAPAHPHLQLLLRRKRVGVPRHEHNLRRAAAAAVGRRSSRAAAAVAAILTATHREQLATGTCRVGGRGCLPVRPEGCKPLATHLAVRLVAAGRLVLVEGQPLPPRPAHLEVHAARLLRRAHEARLLLERLHQPHPRTLPQLDPPHVVRLQRHAARVGPRHGRPALLHDVVRVQVPLVGEVAQHHARPGEPRGRTLLPRPQQPLARLRRHHRRRVQRRPERRCVLGHRERRGGGAGALRRVGGERQRLVRARRRRLRQRAVQHVADCGGERQRQHVADLLGDTAVETHGRGQARLVLEHVRQQHHVAALLERRLRKVRARPRDARRRDVRQARRVPPVPALRREQPRRAARGAGEGALAEGEHGGEEHRVGRRAELVLAQPVLVVRGQRRERDRLDRPRVGGGRVGAVAHLHSLAVSHGAEGRHRQTLVRAGVLHAGHLTDVDEVACPDKDALLVQRGDVAAHVRDHVRDHARHRERVLEQERQLVLHAVPQAVRRHRGAQRAVRVAAVAVHAHVLDDDEVHAVSEREALRREAAARRQRRRRAARKHAHTEYPPHLQQQPKWGAGPRDPSMKYRYCSFY